MLWHYMVAAAINQIYFKKFKILILVFFFFPRISCQPYFESMSLQSDTVENFWLRLICLKICVNTRCKYGQRGDRRHHSFCGLWPIFSSVFWKVIWITFYGCMLLTFANANVFCPTKFKHNMSTAIWP